MLSLLSRAAFVWPLILLWTVTAVQASFVVPSTLEFMIGSSEAIVIGRVLERHSYWEEGKIFTDVRISVEKYIKQPPGASGSGLTLKNIGGQVGDTRWEVDQAPAFQSGEEVLLFLKRAGLKYVPYGLNYGVYRIRPAGGGRRVTGPWFEYQVHYDLKTGRAYPAPAGQKGADLGEFIRCIESFLTEPGSGPRE